MTGTSQAVPIITAAISIMKERYPFLTIEQVKHIIKINSIQNEYTLKYTQVGFFSFDSFIRWMNNNYKAKDFFPNRKKLAKIHQTREDNAFLRALGMTFFDTSLKLEEINFIYQR